MEKKFVTEEEFNVWVNRMVQEYRHSYAISEERGDTTYVYLRSKVGKAKRRAGETYNGDIGLAYAYARCTGQDEYYIKESKQFNARATGMIKFVDDLGRILIPKEIRKQLNLRAGAPLEVYTTNDSVIFKKCSR